MFSTQSALHLKGIGMLLRIVAVAFSSVAAILSTVLPLFMHYSLSSIAIIRVAIILLIGAILIHGILTHTLNDLTDYKSGTDQYSPGLLSGGSRVLQTGTMSERMLIHIGIGVSVFLLFMTAIFAFLGYTKFAILTLVGLWGAGSYSLKPLRFAYYPFIGEWLSLFPTMLMIGLAAPWVLLDRVPIWAWQNACINAVWCMAWVMVHHIPDRQADRKAKPLKRTSVVWAEDMWGKHAAKWPALLYFALVGILLIWTAFNRPIAAIGAGFILFYSIYLIIKMKIQMVEDVTTIEKKLLVCAFITAIWLGIFV